MNWIKSLIYNLVSRINQTHLLFQNNLRASDGNVKNIDLLSCYANEDTSVTLNTEELAKLRDWNIKVSLGYKQMLCNFRFP